MGRIPIVTGQIAARSLRTGDNTINAYADDNAFGGQVGRALGVAAGGLERVGDALYDIEKRRSEEKAINAVAQADFTRKELEVRQSIGPDGKDLQAKTLEAFDVFVDEKANEIDDDRARMAFRTAMAKERNRVSSRSVTQEFALDGAYSKEQADASLTALENKIMSDPTGFDDYVAQGTAVIDTRVNIPASIRETMKLKYRQDAAKARFNGMAEAATSVEDIDRISAELTARPQTTGEGKDDYAGKDWQAELSPVEFEQMVNKLGTARKAFITKADADARAALDTLDGRNDKAALIPQDELKAVGSLVKKSANPVTVAKYARIVRDQDIIAEARKLPPAEQRAQISAARGNPGSAFPGMPARVSSAINAATQRFNVSGGFLAVTVEREYGQFLKTKRSGNQKYAPSSVHSGVDLRNVRPDVVDAATVAGELFGSPLSITSGYRSQSQQDTIRARGNPNRPGVAKQSHHTDANALDVSTVGMSDEDRGRLVGALVDAGFTGIGEYDTHVHADFRNAVPASFGNKEGKTWGGWTYLSPAVAGALAERGFASGVTSDTIKRKSGVASEENIDYGQGTQLTKDDGRPASSAVGVAGMTEGTFLGLMRDPKVSARIGVDISEMSDEQILALRKDPEISILAAAALGEQNVKTMQNVLGRSVSDAETYMAHFLGSGGAVTLIKARDNLGSQSAAKLLPKAAASNRPIFYDKSGKARTVEEVYNLLSRDFVAAPTKVSFDDVQTRQKVLDETTKALADNPMQYARETGSQTVPEFSLDTLREYGDSVRQVAQFYNLPIDDMKVLGPDELNALKSELGGDNSDRTLEVITSLQEMGDDVARAAFKQLGEKDNVYAYAGSMNLETGQSSVAADIVRGQHRLTQNPDIKKQIGATPDDLADAFVTATGNALNDASPKVRQDVQDAAIAHYVETVVARGRGAAFDQEAFTRSVDAVLGGQALGEVNGEPTVLPPGMSADQVETAMQSMTVADWAAMSPSGLPPHYVDGTLIAPADLADEAKLRAIGAGQYRIQLDDGTYAVTGGTSPNGRLEVYVFQPDQKKFAEIEKRGYSPDTDFAPPAYMPEGTNIFQYENQYGNFDEAGRWTGRK